MSPKADPYLPIIDFILDECGACFSDVPSNLNAIAKHLGIDRRQTHAALGLMVKRGILQWDKVARTWTVVEGVRAV